MKKLIMPMLGFIACISFAQENAVTVEFSKCSQHIQQEKYFSNHPEHRLVNDRDQQLFQREYERYLAQGELTTRSNHRIIPVVVHIVHENGSENISDAQVASAIAQLNRDFNNENSDLGNTVSAFRGRIGNPDIEFRLAKIDPAGNCHSGITRTFSSATRGGNTGSIVSAVSAQHGTWPQNRYMSIFVCRDVGGAGGFTWLPGNWYPQDGMERCIYILHNSMGTIGTGRWVSRHTLAHEVGHWLNLPHTWGGSNNPGLSTNCNDDDGVADTPNTVGNRNCNTAANSCGSLDNVQNFMEYSFCSTMFTEGQAARMNAALNSSVAGRNKLWNNNAPHYNLTRTGVADEGGLCEVTLNADKTGICRGEVVKYNFAASTDALTEIRWTFEGGNPSTSTSRSPEVTYNTNGNFDVTLQVKDQVYTLSDAKQNLIQVSNTGVCNPSISASERTLCQGEEATYSFDAGNINVQTVRWIFEGGVPATSNLRNPTVSYPNPGTYDVTLELEDNEKAGSKFINNFIVVNTSGTCELAISSSTTNVCEGGEIEYSFISPLTNLNSIEWTFEGGTPSTSNDSNPKVTYPTPGTYNVGLLISDGTENLVNNVTGLIQVLSDDITLTLPIEEGFELVSALPDNKRMYTKTLGQNDIEISSSTSSTGNKSVIFNGYDLADTNRYALVSPPIDLSQLTETDRLLFNFKYAYNSRFVEKDERLKVYVSNDCGETWVLKRQLLGGNFASNNLNTRFVPSDDDWKKIAVPDIGSDFYVANFRYKIEFLNDNGNNLYIDDINLSSINTAGLFAEPSLESFSLYPNPTSGLVNLSYDGSLASGAIIEVFNLLGERLVSKSLPAFNEGTKIAIIELTDFPAGVYTVRMLSDGSFAESKIIKQ